jgi:hypothetical protein
MNSAGIPLSAMNSAESYSHHTGLSTYNMRRALLDMCYESIKNRSKDTCFRIKSFPNATSISFLSSKLIKNDLNNEIKVHQFLHELFCLFVSINKLDIIDVNLKNNGKWEVQTVIEEKQFEDYTPLLKTFLMQFNLSTNGTIGNVRTN